MNVDEGVLIEEMQNNLDNMFRRISSKEYQDEQKENAARREFGKSQAEKQSSFISQKADACDDPPKFEANWSQSQSVKQANSQFRVFSSFVQSEEKRIDKDVQDLNDLHMELTRGVGEMFGDFYTEQSSSNYN